MTDGRPASRERKRPRAVARGRARAGSSWTRSARTSGLVGTHVGCEHGVCGTCTILLDGRSVRSCISFAVQADGAEIRTVEDLAEGQTLHPLQDEFWDKQGLQCGYCTPGMLMRAVELLEENPDPSPDEIREGIAGNLCRCTGYQYIVEAVIAPPRGCAARTPKGHRHDDDRRPRGSSTARPPAQGRAHLGGQVHPPRRGPEVPAGTRWLHRRPIGARDAARRGAAEHPGRTRGSPASTSRRPGRARGARGDHRPEAASSASRSPTSGPTRLAHLALPGGDKVRYVGEGVAVVVADNRYLAEDAMS